ncbi:MAG: outer membrane protein assembly factor BamE [Ancalomicrobiaceae bacterium]|nr:outer membrane protein assembly factor BamE [Ancalomicrobiaceae bacterium]
MPGLRSSSPLVRVVAATVLSLAVLGGCAEEYSHGYIQSQDSISQIQPGSSREQVLLVLGSPSTSSTIGGESFYYISQKTERNMAFATPGLVDQRVLAVYFDDKGKVKELANYGLQDGKIFDFISRKTKTTGQDIGVLGQILKAAPGLGLPK